MAKKTKRVKTITRRWRAIRPEGTPPAFPHSPQEHPVWAEPHSTEADARRYRDEYYPGWTLEVEVTTVHAWAPVEEV